ncbi:MAG TPA: cysteine hydrolase, partial [Methanocorpusculum sp.]|nr:cysteine hydrolase [Methanocorpusculum sp.]
DASNVEQTRRELFLKTPFIVRGTPGAKIIPELTPAPGEHILIKPRYSAFFQTGLNQTLREHGTDHLLIAGTQYPNCIRATVTDALSLDYQITLLTDCCSAQTPEIASANITDLQNLGARCITSEEWQKTRP